MSDARTFLARVLPWADTSASYFNLHWRTQNNRWHGRGCKSLDDLCKTLDWAKKQPTVLDLYTCMSSQRVATSKTANGFTYYWAERSIPGADHLKSLFLDVDVKAGAYTTTLEAYNALGKFLADSGIRRPTLIVETGSGGFHCHWLLDRPLKPAEWKKMALALENAAKQHGLLHDAAVTIDAARILRIPDTFNYKWDPPRLAKLNQSILPNDYPVEVVQQWLANYVVLEAPRSATSGVGGAGNVHNLNDELGAGIGFSGTFNIDEFVSAVEYLDGLNPSPFARGAYEAMRDLHFVCAYIELNNSLDATAARDLIAGVVDRNGRDAGDNAKRYNDALTKTAAKLKSGEDVLRPATFFKMAQDKGWSVPKASPGTPDPDLPPGYTRQDDGTIWRSKINSDGLTTLVMVAPYPMTDARVQHNPRTLIFETKISGKISTVMIQSEKAARRDQVAPTLAAQGFMLKPLHVADAQEFIVAWITHLQNTRRTSNANAFGWTAGGFAYDGSVHTAAGREYAGAADANTQRQYEPCGDLQVWKDAALVITDQKRPELDAILASAFAAPLVKLLGQDGLMVSAYSTESGIGKTTALRVAQAVWGHPIEAAQSLEDTANSVIGKLGEIRNLPMYWDEIKSEDQVDKFIKVAFQLSGGREKTRMTQNAGQRRSGSWETMLLCCSNDSIIDSISSQSQASGASLYRCFEFRVPPPTQPSALSQPTVSVMINKLKTNFGQAGLVYARYLGSNAALIEKEAVALNQGLAATLKSGNDERFWIATMSSLVRGAIIANHLELTKIDVKALLHFLRTELDKMRGGNGLQSTMTHIPANAADKLSGFLRDMRGRHTLITNRIHRGGGRAPIGTVTPKYSDEKLVDLKVHIGADDRFVRVSANDLRLWLQQHKIPVQTTIEAFRQQFNMTSGFLTLGAGTPHGTGQMRVHEFDLNHASMTGFFDALA